MSDSAAVKSAGATHQSLFIFIWKPGVRLRKFFPLCASCYDAELLFVSRKGWHVVGLLQGVVVGDIPDSRQVEGTEKLKPELRGIWERIDAAPL